MLKPGSTAILSAIGNVSDYYGRNGFLSSDEYGYTVQYIEDLARTVLSEYVPNENRDVYGSDESKSFAAIVDAYLVWLERVANSTQC